MFNGCVLTVLYCVIYYDLYVAVPYVSVQNGLCISLLRNAVNECHYATSLRVSEVFCFLHFVHCVERCTSLYALVAKCEIQKIDCVLAY